MFDVFYSSHKPCIYQHERFAENIADAAWQCRTTHFWWIDGDNDYSEFDFSWLPDRWEDEHKHIFPSQWSRDSGTYLVNKLTWDVNHYRHEQLVPKNEHYNCMFLPDDVVSDSVDFTWHPDPSDPPYIYLFPTQYQLASGVEYRVPGATETKYVSPFQIKHCVLSSKHWVIPDDVVASSVDLTWRPNPMDPPYIYLFPTQYQRASGVEYRVPGATETKYVSPFQIKHCVLSSKNWVIPDNILNPDLTWRPNPMDPPYIYKFPSRYVRDSGLEYHVPGATTVKFVDDISVSFDAAALPRYYITTTIEDLIAEHKDETFWALNNEMDYQDFDFSWTPDVSQQDYVHVFGSQWQKHSQTYYVLPLRTGDIDSRQYNYVGDQIVQTSTSIGIIYIDKSNAGSAERYKALCSQYDNVTRVRFVSSIFDTIKRASNKISQSRFWVVTSENDYSSFNFGWHAEPWQSYMLHVFGSTQQKWSDTFLINKNVFDTHCRWCKDIKDMPDLNFVKDQTIQPINVNDIYNVDFGQQTKVHAIGKTTRFVDSYLDVIKRVVEHATSEYIWMTSNICDYSNFNFDWRPEPYQATMLHVFSDGTNKFGDTFLIHVPTFQAQSKKLKLLDWYNTVNYNNEQVVPRRPYDIVTYTGDNLTNAIKQHNFDTPYALFCPEHTDISTITYTPSVWRLKDRSIHTFTESSSVVLAPRDTLQYLDTQCYDYPQIKRHKAHFLAEKALDIVYISNGETHAQRNWEILQKITANVPNRVVHVQGVKGRAQAYRAAAKASETDWFFSVFAKLEVDQDFDWGWQTDRLQQPKHYIFHARNDTVGINYGHASIIAYNKLLVLSNQAQGLDFTLDQEHEVVPVHSGVTYYHGDIITAWRSSFREAIKLYKNIQDGVFVEISQERLDKWCSSNGTPEGNWNAKGGNDGIAYYTEVNGNFNALRLSYDWEWLDQRFNKIYKDNL